MTESITIHGIVFILISSGRVLLERCPKKKQTLRVGEWFVPGGKIEPNETPLAAMKRELMEELGVTAKLIRELPIIEGSPVPPGPKGLFLMRPYIIDVWEGEIPSHTLDEGRTELRWVPLGEALWSPVPQIRMMMAGTLVPSGEFISHISTRVE